jgi:hypothetical protein
MQRRQWMQGTRMLFAIFLAVALVTGAMVF